MFGCNILNLMRHDLFHSLTFFFPAFISKMDSIMYNYFTAILDTYCALCVKQVISYVQ